MAMNMGSSMAMNMGSNPGEQDKVDRLCRELSGLCAGNVFAPAPAAGHPQHAFHDRGVGGGGGGAWPPAGLVPGVDAPTAVGVQEGLRYAIYPGQRRVAEEAEGQIFMYD